MNKKGISPVIATILLIAIVIVIAMIIFLWARSFITEVIQKQGRAAEQVCSDVNLEARLSGTSLSLINKGNIPIDSLDVKKTKEGSTEVERVETKLGPGQSNAYEIRGDDWEKVIILPVLLGESGTSRVKHVCNNKVIEPEIE